MIKLKIQKEKGGERSVVAEFISASPRAGTSPAPTGNAEHEEGKTEEPGKEGLPGQLPGLLPD